MQVATRQVHFSPSIVQHLLALLELNLVQVIEHVLGSVSVKVQRVEEPKQCGGVELVVAHRQERG